MRDKIRRGPSLQQKLINRAKELALRGFSPIPVHGNSAPSEPKRPAVKWRAYQKRIASGAEIERLFQTDVSALGIVCGQISRLLVIDFDDVLRFQRFCRHLPQYAATYTVKTKRGFHLYFRTSVKVPSHQFDGGDIKGERSYILAPPSTIDSFVYECIHEVKAREVTEAEVDQLLMYFHVKSATHMVAGRRIREPKEVDFPALYQRLAGRIGRNNALYRVASLARDAGSAKEEAGRLLLRMHANMPSHPRHKVESWEERWEEGLRTINSAFAKDGRRPANTGSIPNTVREKLLQAQRSTVVGRLLECFAFAGWEAESYFTLRKGIDLGERYGLNRKSVLQALTGDRCVFDGRHIISRRYVEYMDIRGLNCRKRGRPAELAFQVPSASRLLEVLKVRWAPSDRLRSEDVRSAKSYRLAVHRAYIERLSPRSYLAVLARRLGVNERTIRRYNRVLDVAGTACVARVRLTRASLVSLPKRSRRTRRNTTEGFWLESGKGARLPGWRHIGSDLLRAGDGAAHICVRRATVYSFRQASPAVQYESVSLGELGRLLLLRGEAVGKGGLRERVSRAVEAARGWGQALRYEKIQLFFGNVDARIADDKTAETITGYLVAQDGSGREVRRPARRGIAYRMLKLYGNGNVHLALRSAYREVVSSLAGHALRAGDAQAGLELAARTLA